MMGHLAGRGGSAGRDGLESVKKTYQVVGVGLPPGLLRQLPDDINPTSV